MFRYSTLFLSTTICTALSACGGGSSGGSGGAAFDPQNAGFSCDERTFFNDNVSTPAIYFNGQIPVSSQNVQGSGTTDNVYTYDLEARTITIDQTNTVNAGRTTWVYTLDDTGKPVKRTTFVENFAIQLSSFTTELRYSYDNEGLLTNYTIHGFEEDQVIDEPSKTVTFTWTDIAGIETSTLPADASSSGSTYTYEYDCTTLTSVEEQFFQTSSSTAVIRNSTVVASGSGKGITTVTTLDSPGVQGRTLVFDSFGSLVQVGTETINHEPTSEQVVNIELFENAIRYKGLI